MWNIRKIETYTAMSSYCGATGTVYSAKNSQEAGGWNQEHAAQGPTVKALTHGSVLAREPVRDRKDQLLRISVAEAVSVKLAPRNASEASGLSDFGNFWWP